MRFPGMFIRFCETDLLRGCSNFETKIPPEAAEVRIIFNYKELCPGEIAGIVIGAIIGVIFLSAVVRNPSTFALTICRHSL